MPLSSAEYRLLSAFVERPRRVLTRDQLLDATRGQGVVVADRAIDLAVSRLRQKLSTAQDGEQLICTIRGEGYIFDAESQVRSRARRVRSGADLNAIVAPQPALGRLASVSTPPWRATRSRAMYRPRPLPPVRRLREVLEAVERLHHRLQLRLGDARPRVLDHDVHRVARARAPPRPRAGRSAARC